MIEKVKSMAEKANTFFAEAGPQLSVTGQQFLAGLSILCILLSLLFFKNMFLPAMVLEFVSLVWYMFTGQSAPEMAGKAGLWSKINLYLNICLLVLVPYSWIAKAAGGGGGAALVGMAFMAVGAAGLTVFQMSDMGKGMWTKLAEVGTKMGKGEDPAYKPGDIILCKDKDLIESGAKDPREILPYKDRFLHMLILGPTGGGKTSQVILPMVDQDIKNFEAGVTVIEPKGDLAREVAMMAKVAGRPYIYFDPSVDNCPFFNPLVGDEDDVIENAVTTFLMLNPDSPQYFKDLSEQLVRYTLKVLKRLDKSEGVDGKYATFINMNTVLQNPNQDGRKLVTRFGQLKGETDAEQKENADIASWFINEYYAERSKVYENSSGIRAQVSKVIANRYLRGILNPDFDKGQRNQIDFDEHLEKGGVICICTAQGMMRDLGKFLGYFIILQLQSAVFRRPGNEDNRRAHFLYIDEFQTYSTPGFSDMLTQGRSYRVASHLATQARAQIAMGGGRDGKNFVELVSTNARNLIIFPGVSFVDAKYYSDQFGEHETVDVVKSESRKKFDLITGGLDRLGHPTESIREQKKMEALFSPTAIMKRPFGELTYSLIKYNSVQPAKVGVVQWLPKEYDRMLKDLIDTEIVPHEYRFQKEHGIRPQPEDKFEDFEFGSSPQSDPLLDPATAPTQTPTSRPVPRPASGTNLGLGEEELAEDALKPPPGSDLPEDMIFDNGHNDPDPMDESFFGSPMTDKGLPQDDFRFDDLSGDPLIDDDDLI